MKKLLFIAIAIFGFSAVSFGQVSATATSSASAKILALTTITNTTPLNFGAVGALPLAPSTVILGTTDSRSGTSTLITGVTGLTAKSAEFALTGTATQAFSITLPIAAITITDGTNNMTVTDFVSFPSLTGTLDGDGLGILKVGATLQVGANQVAGQYSGTYPVTVIYN